ncbi:MAG: DUF998 domain-containing protein [Mycobacteriales bacterium]
MNDTLTAPATTTCDPASRVTKSLLGYGVIAGPVYVAVSLAQALTRDGFDPSRHEWSLLANGPLGWIQSANLVLTGLMTIAAAAGLRRALDGRRAGLPAGLLAGFGAGMVGAGFFRADPSDGFPPGTPSGRNTHVSWHGMLHLVTGGAGFLCLIAACLAVGAWFARRGDRRWARYSRATGVIYLAAFAGIAGGATGRPAVLAFTAAVLLAFGWLSATSVRLYRQV